MAFKHFFVGAFLALASIPARGEGFQCRSVTTSDGISGKVNGFSIRELEPGKVEIRQLYGRMSRENWTRPEIRNADCTFSRSGYFLVDCDLDGVEHVIVVTKRYENRLDRYGIVTFSEDPTRYYYGFECSFF